MGHRFHRAEKFLGIRAEQTIRCVTGVLTKVRKDRSEKTGPWSGPLMSSIPSGYDSHSHGIDGIDGPY